MSGPSKCSLIISKTKGGYTLLSNTTVQRPASSSCSHIPRDLEVSGLKY